jgi:hypothetical protein
MSETKPKGNPAWIPGVSGNPNGRPKGSRNKLAEDFVKALADDFKTHGVAAVAKVRTEKPDVYVRVIAQLLPKDVRVQHTILDDLSAMSDEDLHELAGRLERELRGAFPGPASGAGSAGNH